MTMETGQQVAPQANSGTPPADPDAAKYEALRQQLGVGEQEQPEPEAEPAPEPAVKEPEAEPEKVPAKPEHVPYAEHENVQKALRESRAAEKTVNDRLAQFMRIVEDARSQRQPKQEAEPDKPKLPDVLEDPVGHFKAEIAELKAALAHTHQGGQQQTQQIQAHLQEQEFWRAVTVSETEIRTAGSASHKADYDDACQHLEASRVRQLDRMYPSDSAHVQEMARQMGFANPAEYKLSLLNQDRRAVAAHALQQNMSPAQLYYNLALDSGYAPKPNGKAPPVDKGKQQVEALKRGKAASLSISGGGSGKGAENMSVADLTDMFDEDPDAAMKIFRKMGEKGLL